MQNFTSRFRGDVHVPRPALERPVMPLAGRKTPGSAARDDLAHAGIRGYKLVFRDPRTPSTKLHVPMHVQILDSTGRTGAPWPGRQD